MLKVQKKTQKTKRTRADPKNPGKRTKIRAKIKTIIKIKIQI